MLISLDLRLRYGESLLTFYHVSSLGTKLVLELFILALLVVYLMVVHPDASFVDMLLG
jgi:hypothetical protein